MADNTTEEELIQQITAIVVGTTAHPKRIVDLIIDLIAERSEDKAEERVDQHERDYDHENYFGT